MIATLGERGKVEESMEATERPDEGLQLTGVVLRAGAAAFDHQFRQGEITVVLGGNAAGKTDLCRYIAGLSSTVCAGSIELDGRSLDDLAAGQRPVGYVYQAFVNYPNLTAFDNIASPLIAQKADAELIESTVRELAGKLRIDELLDRYPHELSGGQQQRLAIARALARQGAVLLLDEPLVNLDFKLREALEVELREILRESGTIVVYTSSDQRDAYTLADNVLLLNDGEKVQSGAPMDLYRQPHSITAMRIMADPQINTWRQAGKLHALRPEHLQLLDPAEQADHEFQFAVDGVETDGSHSLLFGHCEDEPWVVNCPGMPEVTVGETIRIGTQALNVVTFDG